MWLNHIARTLCGLSVSCKFDGLITDQCLSMRGALHSLDIITAWSKHRTIYGTRVAVTPNYKYLLMYTAAYTVTHACWERYCMDDTVVRTVSVAYVLSQQAYMLFYTADRCTLFP